MTRKIIHIDMDAFFASVEQRDFPHLKGKPVAVGSPSKRGVIAAASYEARKFGVYSAMSSKQALKKCPNLIFQSHRFEVYKSVSAQIMSIMHEYTDLVEPLSIDEAFLDVTTNKQNLKSATLIAKEIKKRIFEETGLYASAGISVNKFMAKIASDQDKPNGLFLIKPEVVIPFIETLPVKKFFGVGAKTGEKMTRLGIYTGKDMKAWSLNGLVDHFGKSGYFFYNICRGIDDRPVITNRVRKSIGIENTFHEDISTEEEREIEMNLLIEGLWKRIERNKRYGKTLTLKTKYNDFTQNTRSKTYETSISKKSALTALSYELMSQVDYAQPVRLMGLSVSNLSEEIELPAKKMVQLTLSFD
ncbi:DNA polymerase IV [Saccharicrinis aurantiacus]|uniref:DNA polymerase IV n=1 Tax=Saccharicrinis aurantiacus TaxID=1849719 RepID=UPI00094FB627|nr:DNA polymerase IV [Saccharicrinis aurantiacus]